MSATAGGFQWSEKSSVNIAGFAIDYKANESGVPDELLDFMKTWLKAHLAEMDKQYMSFLNARGVR